MPARVAGVSSLTVCTPRAARETLAAAYVARVDFLFTVGGAQAIAALAFGTRMIPRVDLIVGPGSAFVTAAKRAGEAEAYGSLFVGEQAGEVFSDYGVGPNHVLPTGGTSRFGAGLSVLTFLAARTYMQSSSAVDETLVRQTASLAACEGLDAHRNSALLRMRCCS